jgi:hypothetical protein
MSEVQEESKVQFFGEIDMDTRTGAIRSERPAWFHEIHIDHMKEEISRKQKFLDLGYYVADQIPRVKSEIEAETKRLKEIESSRPVLTGAALDRVSKAYESLGKQISDQLPTRKESKNGLVSPHEELKRQNTKSITIPHDLAKACGVKAEGRGTSGRITGKEAAKCYQIMGKALGSNTNIERLRKDGGGEAYKTMHDLTQMILKEKFGKGT